MLDMAPAGARPHGTDRYRDWSMSLAARLAATYGVQLHDFDAAELARRDREFAAVYRHGRGEAEAEEIFCQALEMDTIRQP